MREHTVITVPADLLPEVLRQLLEIATDPNLVEVADEERGRVIRAHPDVAEAWYQAKVAEMEKPKAVEQEQAKVTETKQSKTQNQKPSASNGEESE